VLPFTRDQFFALFAAYNSATWPAAVFAYPLAIILTALALRDGPRNSRYVAAGLMLMWAYVGVVYHGLYFSRINLAAPIFAGAFLVQALLFARASTTGREIKFDERNGTRSALGLALIFYATIAYPVIGFLAGQHYPAMPLFGVAPCPLLIFTFGLFTLASYVRWSLWIVPLLWAMIGTGGFYILEVPQDAGLIVSALVAIGVHSQTRVSLQRFAARR
jgi:hypothetical protein